MKINIIQVAHVTNTPGPVQTLVEFLENNSKNIVKKYWFALENGYFGYVVDFWKAYQKIKKEKKLDIAIGMNCFDTLPLILLRKNRIKKIVFFGTDFSRKRFSNKILNFVYVVIDRYCAKKSDFVCCNTQRTINQRINEGINSEKIIYTPNGVFLNKIKVGEKKNYDRKLVYVGHVSKEHGLENLIRLVIKTKLVLDVIGDGPDLENLKKKYFDERVKFLGRKSHNEVLKYLVDFRGFGVAPYNRISDWTYYCDPVKIKEYLAFGIPIIISDVPEISERIKNEKLGYVFKNKEELRTILKQIKMLKGNYYQEMVKRISKIRINFDLNKIYKNMVDTIDAKDCD